MNYKFEPFRFTLCFKLSTSAKTTRSKFLWRKLVVKNMKLHLVLVTVLLMGCTATPELEAPKKPKVKVPSAVRLHLTSLYQKGNCGITDKKTVLIKTPAEWQELWSEVVPLPHGMVAKPLTIDFLAGEMIVATFMGEQPSGGHSIEIVSLWVNHKNELEVYIREKRPSKGGMVTMAMTQPFHIVKVESCCPKALKQKVVTSLKVKPVHRK